MTGINERGLRYERWLAGYAETVAFPLLPAATVVLLRPGAGADGGIETLLVRRNPELRVMGGLWVFPGGQVDAVDYPGTSSGNTDRDGDGHRGDPDDGGDREGGRMGDGSRGDSGRGAQGACAGGGRDSGGGARSRDSYAAVRESSEEVGESESGSDGAGGGGRAGCRDTYGAARRAGVREVAEEAGVRVDAASLVRLSHWTPPPDFPHQLTTWFFVAPAPEGTVRVDGGEIAEHIWLSPAEALRRHIEAGGTWFLPPTYVTLLNLCPFGTVADALRAARSEEPPFYVTRLAYTDDGHEVALWEGDAAYESGDLDAPGGRHRLWHTPGQPWRFEHN